MITSDFSKLFNLFQNPGAASDPELLSCHSDFSEEVFHKVAAQLGTQVLNEFTKTDHLTQDQLYKLAYTSQMISALYSDICLATRNRIYRSTAPEFRSRLKLLEKVHEVLVRQSKGDVSHVYESGYLYQGIDTLTLLGSRDAEQRYHSYMLSKHIAPGSEILDIGANCGFMGILSARNLACTATCVDHNPFMLEVGKIIAEFYDVDDLVTFDATRIQAKTPKAFDIVFSFASHWTDDGGIRNTLKEHFQLITKFTKPGTKIFFESHCNDLCDNSYDASIQDVQLTHNLEIVHRTLVDNDTRDFVIFRC